MQTQKWLSKTMQLTAPIDSIADQSTVLFASICEAIFSLSKLLSPKGRFYLNGDFDFVVLQLLKIRML